jgi:hypothetical protein
LFIKILIEFSSDISSILDQAFIEESTKRDLLNSLSLPIQVKTQLLPVTKPQLNISTNFFDMVLRLIIENEMNKYLF